MWVAEEEAEVRRCPFHCGREDGTCITSDCMAWIYRDMEDMEDENSNEGRCRLIPE